MLTMNSKPKRGLRKYITSCLKHWKEEKEDSLAPVTFREPDWDRLADLGPNPVWVLETKKGNVEITVDVLTAPATISGMDSLITNGHYNGVAFHRVVPNFVIQGGDVETGLGFGGPDYTVPTEASEVTDGMSVVDRITQGDIVQRSYWK